MVSYFTLEGTKYEGFPKEKNLEVGLAEVAYQVAVDPSRRLIWAADSSRIKSFGYRSTAPSTAKSDSGHDSNAEDDDDDEEHWQDEEDDVDAGLLVHTLRARQGGPIAVVDGGKKLLRGGKGEIAIWNVDGLPTHGPNGRKRIGKKISTEDTWRDEEDYIEDSAGSPATSTTKVTTPTGASLDITCWTSSPANPNVMISSMEKMYSCYGVDMASGGKVAMRYLGHGGHITGFSKSAIDDPLKFLTSARDGLARLYDVRVPLPVLSIDAGLQSEFCPSALYVHVQGIPGARVESLLPKPWIC